MLRNSLVSILVFTALAMTPSSDAQRQPAQIVQGATSGELAATVEDLRVSNAQLRARMTGIESDKAQLNGKVETLQFQLSESRSQIDRMQGDDAELQRLITRLEARLSEQEDTIADLNRQINALRPEPAFLSSDAGSFGDNAADQDGSEMVSAMSAPVAQSVESNTGPTRIVRRVEGDVDGQAGEPITQLGSNGQPLPQGSLGTLSASALPGDAGELFAEAKSRLLQFDYAGAEAAFRAFLTQFGDDPQAGEAQYWLAEVLYQQEAFPESGAAYTDMIRSYPDDPRAPEALAKLARSMRLVGDTAQACNALDLLPQRYPNASGVTKNLAAGERVRSGCDG
jgi:tol-pal system protein YbgF